jgi:hypothetical protein
MNFQSLNQLKISLENIRDLIQIPANGPNSCVWPSVHSASVACPIWLHTTGGLAWRVPNDAGPTHGHSHGWLERPARAHGAVRRSQRGATGGQSVSTSSQQASSSLHAYARQHEEVQLELYRGGGGEGGSPMAKWCFGKTVVVRGSMTSLG